MFISLLPLNFYIECYRCCLKGRNKFDVFWLKRDSLGGGLHLSPFISLTTGSGCRGWLDRPVDFLYFKWLSLSLSPVWVKVIDLNERRNQHTMRHVNECLKCWKLCPVLCTSTEFARQSCHLYQWRIVGLLGHYKGVYNLFEICHGGPYVSFTIYKVSFTFQRLMIVTWFLSAVWERKQNWLIRPFKIQMIFF